MKKLSTFLVFLSLLGVGFVIDTQSADAVSGADWRPGRIIDDVVFQNKSSMTVAQIQQFLDSKVPTCDRWGTQPMWSGGPTRAQWSIDNGKDHPPYTCLKEYVENPDTKINNGHDPTVAIPGGLSAAQLIYNAAQAQNVNPQVFLVLLQKEQSLVTDDWPYSKQFERATGNNCPDTAPCNPQFAWLWTQVNNAGAQFNYYVTHFDQYNYAPGWNNILYNPNGSCGTQSVFIENAYTAALYIYTPYVPNAAALNNLYGTGDVCSAYGNRNFWRMFNDWFGSSINPPRTAQLLGVAVDKDYAQLPTSERSVVTYSFRNAGSVTWQRSGPNPVRLGTTIPYDRSSLFCDSTWLSCSRPAAMNEQEVAPGQTATFTFTIQAPTIPATYFENFGVLAEGIAWMYQSNDSLYVNVVPATFSYNVESVHALTPIQSQEVLPVTIRVRNTGNTSWHKNGNNPVILGTADPLERSSVFRDQSWLGINRVSRLVENIVPPNGIGTFSFTLTGPATGIGLYSEKFQLVSEGQTWFQQAPLSIPLDLAGSYNSTFTGLSEIVIPRGESKTVTITARNNGTATWSNNPSDGRSVKLVTDNPLLNSSGFCDASWIDGCKKVAFAQQDGTLPGQDAQFTVTLKAPNILGLHPQVMTLYSEQFGKQNGNILLPIRVIEASNSWATASIDTYSDTTKATRARTDLLYPGRRVFISVRVQNTGNTLWKRDGAHPVRLGTSNTIDRASPFCDSTWLSCNRVTSLKELTVAPGEYGTFEFWYKGAASPIFSMEHFSLVIEGKGWLTSSYAIIPSIVSPKTYSWQKLSQFAYTDATKTTPVDLTNLSPNQKVYIGLVAQNTGSAEWRKNTNPTLNIGTTAPRDRISVFCDVTWLSCARPGSFTENGVVESGKIATFEFWYKAPASTGQYNEAFSLVADGATWLNETGTSYYTVVK